ncbi:MAG: dihydrolipoyl dehydrogenase [Chlamydiae bacterium]|nr:dihydrolipoyl dehydrogenase [Chlamydiota bacterium]
MKDMDYDLIVIGGGPGGYVAAIKAAQAGLKVALIEKDKVGGTCLLRGCIPTKTLLASAHIVGVLQKAKEFGVSVENFTINYQKMKERKDLVVSTLCNGVLGLVKSNGIDVFAGVGSFISPKEIKVRGEKSQILTGKKIIIATGSTSSTIPSAPVDFHKIHDSTSILEITKLPKSLLILGAGYIGCEFASLFGELGVKVSLVEFLPGIVWTQGKSISESLTTAFTKKGIQIYCNRKMERCDLTENGVTLHLSDQSKLEAEMLLVSVGRKPYTDELNLGAAGIGTTPNGFISVNEKMETEVKGIYAIGDVTGKSMLAHAASHQGIIAALNASGKSEKMAYESIPAVIFTDPEIATIGYTVDLAKEKGYDAVSHKFPFSALGKALAAGEPEGYAELVTEKKTGRILGAFLVGSQSGNLISEIALAIDHEITIDSLANTIHPHPTLSEALSEAALLASGFPIHLPPGKKHDK